MLNLKGKRCARSKTTVTVDRRHKELVDKFERNRKVIPQKQRALNQLVAEMEKLDPIMDMNRHSEIMFEIDSLKREIEMLNDNSELKQYYAEHGHIISEYHNIPATSGRNNVSNNSENTILKYFNDDDTTTIADEDEYNDNEADTQSVVTLSDSKSPTKNRSDVAKAYFRKVDPEAYQAVNKVDPSKCPTCKIEMTSDVEQGIIFCDECGFTDEAVIDSKKSSYKDPPPSVSYYAYQRKNHFVEILQQFQGKENVSIPEEVFVKIRSEIKKDRIRNLAVIDYKKMKAYLKKLGFSKYYENIPYILSKITGEPAPQFSSEIEKQLITMFDITQGPWDIVCPPERDNFLNYKYTLYKFIELLGLHEYKKYVNLLTNRERLIEQDKIWKAMCAEVHKNNPELADRWLYIPSI